MPRRARLLLCAAAAVLATCRRESPARVEANVPVVLISIDTLRSDHLPAYGYGGVETPHLDAFRRDAILFRRAYSPCPMTLPAHVTMLTGLDPPAHGVRNNIGFDFHGESHPSLPALLKQRGYATGAAVSSYVLRRETGLAAVFDAYDDVGLPRPGAAFADFQRGGGETVARAEQWLAGRTGAPFFFFLHVYEPHVPYEPPPRFRRFPLAYDGEIATADEYVGELLEFLKKAGAYDRALIIVTSDHGEGLGDHGEEQHSILLYREALQVPLLVKLPFSERGGESVEAPAQLADLLPTVTERLGLPSPPAVRGASLLRLPASRPLYAETLYPRLQLGWSDLRSLVDGAHHYIEGPKPELYDLTADPAETRDLATADPDTAARMRSELARTPAAAAAPGAVDPAVAERLAALGYVGTTRPRGAGALPNPRDKVHLLGRIRDGLRLADAARYGEAVAVLSGILRDDPDMADVWTKLGEVYRRMGRLDDSARAYAEAARRCPAPDMVLALAQAELARGRLERAEAQAQAVRRTSLRTAGELLIAEIAIRRGDFEGALRTLGEAERAAAAQEAGRVYRLEFLRGDALARLARAAEAEAAYRREIESFPDELPAYANLAVLQFVQGRRAAAQATLEEMARANPGPPAVELAAKTSSALGDSHAAASWRARKLE